MKRHRIMLLVAAAVAWIHTPASADQGLALKYKFKKGDQFVYRAKTEMKQKQEIAGMPLENELINEAVTTYTVTGVDDKGNYDVTVKGERLKVTATFAALGEYKFDSTSNERDKASLLGGSLTPLFERLSGIVYQTKISPEGEILAVTGYAEQVKDVIEGNPLASQFGGGGSNEAAKQGLRELFVRFDKKALKPGESWEVPNDLELPGIGKTKGKSAYKYVGPDKLSGRDTAKADVSGDTALELNVEQDGAKVTGTISSTELSGTVHFDAATGRVVRSETTMSLGGDLTIDANGMTIPLKNEQKMKTTIELLDKVPE